MLFFLESSPKDASCEASASVFTCDALPRRVQALSGDVHCILEIEHSLSICSAMTLEKFLRLEGSYLQYHLHPHCDTTIPSYLYLKVMIPCSSIYRMEMGSNLVGTQQALDTLRGDIAWTRLWIMACFVGDKWSLRGKKHRPVHS